MRILLAAPVLLLGACNVSTANNAVTVQYDQNTAENAAADVANTAQDIGAAIGNDVDRTADKVNNSDIVANGDSGRDDSNTTANEQ